MSKKKMVENYHLLEVVGEIDGKYQIIKAKHVIDKHYYTIKKLKIKNDKNQLLYQAFMNQASLMKKINHVNIAKCHKMLKTSSSIYVVYDYCAGETLSQWMESKRNRDILEKDNIARQICIAIAEMRKASICHLHLTPDCIYISSQGQVKVTDFLYGTQLPQNGQDIELSYKVPKTEFIAPQVKKGFACYESDIFSFGKILIYMNFEQSKKGTLSSKQFNIKVQETHYITKLMCKKSLQDRANIEQVYTQIFKHKGKIKKMKSLSMSLSKLGKDSLMTKNSWMSMSQSKGMTSYGSCKNLVLQILKTRNLAKLLINLMRSINDRLLTSSQLTIVLSILLLKKSTITITKLAKFMKHGKNQGLLIFNQKEKGSFFKSGDYFKLQPLIQSEMNFQKKQYQNAINSVYLDNVKLLKISKFSQQVKKQEFDNAYFMDTIKQYLKKACSNEFVFLNAPPTILKQLIIMSYILQCNSVDEFFNKKITDFPISLEEQPIILKIKNMGIQELHDQLTKKYVQV